MTLPSYKETLSEDWRYINFPIKIKCAKFTRIPLLCPGGGGENRRRRASVLSRLGSSVRPSCVWWWYLNPRLATPFKDISFLQGAARLQTLLISLHLDCHHLRRPPLKLRRPRALCSAVTFQGRLFERGSPIRWRSWLSNLPAAHRIRSHKGSPAIQVRGRLANSSNPKSRPAR
jgi:hypothetical protein